jgi:hypothetical protein
VYQLYARSKSPSRNPEEFHSGLQIDLGPVGKRLFLARMALFPVVGVQSTELHGP